MSKDKSQKTVHILISGRVQGVSYRWWFKKEAEKNQLNGWVRNRTSNKVEAEIFGSEKNIQSMIKKCKSGPLLANVDEVLANYIDKLTQTDIDIKGIKILETI